jgi:hypothetical protein
LCFGAIAHHFVLGNEFHDPVEILDGLSVQLHLDLILLPHLLVLLQDLLKHWAIHLALLLAHLNNLSFLLLTRGSG